MAFNPVFFAFANEIFVASLFLTASSGLPGSLDEPWRVPCPRGLKVDNQQVGALPRPVQEVPVQLESQGQIFYSTRVEGRREIVKCK